MILYLILILSLITGMPGFDRETYHLARIEAALLIKQAKNTSANTFVNKVKSLFTMPSFVPVAV